MNRFEDPATDAFEVLRRERRANHLSKKMEQFHNYFKAEFNMIYELADGTFESRGLSLPAFLRSGRELVQHLTMHHTIEERVLFPVLGGKMPQFGMKTHTGEHLNSHKQIHQGLDAFTELIDKWSLEPTTYSPPELKTCLDGFRGVLFRHLDEEVADLRGENLLKYFTVEEIERFPI